MYMRSKVLTQDIPVVIREGEGAIKIAVKDKTFQVVEGLVMEV